MLEVLRTKAFLKEIFHLRRIPQEIAIFLEDTAVLVVVDGGCRGFNFDKWVLQKVITMFNLVAKT